MDRCYFCHVSSTLVRHVCQWGERIVVLNNVPADVCTQCGERYFGPEALEQMERMRTNPPTPNTILEVPVYTV